MHYEVKFDTPEAAIQHCREWMSPRQWEAAKDLAMTENEASFRLGMSFCGIQGYPVKVLREYFLNGGV